MKCKPPLADGQVARLACAPCLLYRAVDEHTGELQSGPLWARRMDWATDLVCGMAADPVAVYWNSTAVERHDQRLPADATQGRDGR